MLSWDDSLHVGPLAFDPAESRRLRPEFFAKQGWGEAAAIESELARRDELLERAECVVLWFEPDLFDQLQLLQVLAQLPEGADVELLQTGDYLGGMERVGARSTLADRGRVDDEDGRSWA